MKGHALALAWGMVVLAGVSAYGQAYDPSPDAGTGRVRFASYFDAELDSIHLLNGNLTLDLPLFTLPGRELSMGLRLSYNAQKWQPRYCKQQLCGLYTGGWRVVDRVGEAPLYSPVYAGCTGTTDFWHLWWVWVDGLGTKHNYVYPSAPAFNGGQCGSSDAPSTDNMAIAESGPGMSMLYTGNASTAAVIRFKDGSSVEFSATPTLRSANGNYLVRGANGLPVQDTAGRTIQFETSTTCYNGSVRLGQTYDYTYDGPNMGRIRSRTDGVDAGQSARYVYDSLYRLKQANAANGSWSIGWTHDVWGNRTSQTPSGLDRKFKSVVFKKKKGLSVPTSIHFDREFSKRCSIMEIAAPDAFGLLYRIASILADRGCNIEVALIATEGHRAIDVFYITNQGQKLSPELEKAVEMDLLEAVAPEGIDR